MRPSGIPAVVVWVGSGAKDGVGTLIWTDRERIKGWKREQKGWRVERITLKIKGHKREKKSKVGKTKLYSVIKTRM